MATLSETTLAQTTPTEKSVSRVLDDLRRRIRLYVIAQGSAWMIAWLASTYWLALAVDYLPVAFGLTDLPWQARLIMLLVIIAGVMAIGWRLLVSRLLVPLSDRSMALIIERHYPDFADGLLTSVEFQERENGDRHRLETRAHRDDLDPGSSDNADSELSDFLPARSDKQSEMLWHTQQSVRQTLQKTQPSKVFDPRPLWIGWMAALALTLPWLAFCLFANQGFQLAASRLVFLSDDVWPRYTHLVELSASIPRSYEMAVIPDSLHRQRFRDGELNVGRGSTFDLVVRAEAPSESNPDRVLPATCNLRFRNKEGARGKVTLSAEGAVIRGHQSYRYSGAPFEAVNSSFVVDVRGGDARMSRHRILVVDNPAIISSELACEFPDYLQNEITGAWTPRTLEMPIAPLPYGTKCELRLIANKPLRKVFVRNVSTDNEQILDFESNPVTRFSINFAFLDGSQILEIALYDQDHVLSPSLFVFELPVVEDLAPEVKVDLDGIGSAITPDAIVPLVGNIEDDYAIDETWIEVRYPDFDPFFDDIELQTSNVVNHAVDFQRLSANGDIVMDADLNNSVTLVVKSADKYDLDSSNHVGAGEAFELEIVSSSELLRRLDRAEVGLRRRLEQIDNEMRTVPLQLVQSRVPLETDDTNSHIGEPDQTSPTDLTDDNDMISERELALLYARRSLMQSKKSASELEGVRDSFEDIEKQLFNNRIDAEERLRRLQDKVIEPMSILVADNFPALIESLESLELKLMDYQLADYDEQAPIEINLLADRAIDHTQQISLKLDEILSNLTQFENYGELVEQFRRLIEAQESLIEETDNERRRQGLQELGNPIGR